MQILGLEGELKLEEVKPTRSRNELGIAALAPMRLQEVNRLQGGTKFFLAAGRRRLTSIGKIQVKMFKCKVGKIKVL